MIVTTLGALVLAARNGASGPALAVSAGLLWAGSDITIKAISNHSDLGILVIFHPFAYVILIWSLVGLLVSAKSLQLGPAVPVIAITSATANIITIAAGPIDLPRAPAGGHRHAARPPRRLRARDHRGGDDAATGRRARAGRVT